MAREKPDLRKQLKQHDARTPAPVAEKPAPAHRPDNPHYRPSRQGMENLTGYFPPEVKNQLMELTIERRRATSARSPFRI